MISEKALFVSILLFLSLAQVSPALGGKGDADLSLSLGVEYGNGDYGADINSDSVTSKVTIGWYPADPIDISLEVPFIYQSNSLTTPFGMGRFRTAGRQQGAASNGLKRSGRSSTASTFDAERSRSGIGDLLLKGGYVVVEESALAPQLRPEVYVKIPTADEDKGLGTGEFDGGIGLTVNKWFGEWNGYAEGIYNFIGKSDDFDLRDFFSYEAGVGYQLTDRLLPGFAVRGATKPSSDSSPYLEARVRALYRISGRLTLDGYMGKGFTDGSADYAAGAELSYRF